MAFPKFNQIAAAEDTGACCVGTSCTRSVTRSQCAILGGIFRKGCQCSSFPCVNWSPSDPNRQGPCCKSVQRNSECNDLQPRYGSLCEQSTYANCVGTGGTWLGPGEFGSGYRCCQEFAEPDPINPSHLFCPLPPHIGRCCKGFPRVCCDGYTEQDCNDRGGTWESGETCYYVSSSGVLLTYDCPDLGACCENGVCHYTTAEACDGAWYANTACEDIDCREIIEPPPDGPGCRKAQTNEAKTKWSLTFCNPIYLGVTVRNSRLKPKGRDLEGWEEGFFEPVSTHLVRAVEPDYTRNDIPDPCRRHFGGLVLGGDGFFHAYVVSRPLYEEEDSIELSLGGLVRKEGDKSDPNEGLFLHAATYHAPYWTEAHMHSSPTRCVRVG